MSPWGVPLTWMPNLAAPAAPEQVLDSTCSPQVWVAQLWQLHVRCFFLICPGKHPFNLHPQCNCRVWRVKTWECLVPCVFMGSGMAFLESKGRADGCEVRLCKLSSVTVWSLKEETGPWARWRNSCSTLILYQCLLPHSLEFREQGLNAGESPCQGDLFYLGKHSHIISS